MYTTKEWRQLLAKVYQHRQRRMLMTTCRFECSNETENEMLSTRIWQTVKEWEEYTKKQVIVCRMTNKEKEVYRVYLSIEDRVKASVSICFEASDKTGRFYELILDKGEEQRISVPVNVKANIYYEKPDYEDR